VRGGYVKIYRSLRDHPIYDSPEYLRAFLDWILEAAYQSENRYFRGTSVRLRAGQLVTSDGRLMQQSDWSRARARAFREFCERHDLARFAPLFVDGQRRGWVATISGYRRAQDGPEAGPDDEQAWPAPAAGRSPYRSPDRSPKRTTPQGTPQGTPRATPRTTNLNKCSSRINAGDAATQKVATATQGAPRAAPQTAPQTATYKKKEERTKKEGTTTTNAHGRELEKGARVPAGALELVVDKSKIVRVHFRLIPDTATLKHRGLWTYDPDTRSWTARLAPKAWAALRSVADVPSYREMEERTAMLHPASIPLELLRQYATDRANRAGCGEAFGRVRWPSNGALPQSYADALAVLYDGREAPMPTIDRLLELGARPLLEAVGAVTPLPSALRRLCAQLPDEVAAAIGSAAFAVPKRSGRYDGFALSLTSDAAQQLRAHRDTVRAASEAEGVYLWIDDLHLTSSQS